ncbi:MAG TPA: hypothetical protein VKG26_13670 [Bacteroidia bacterium]|nr:hypothetical protein [Bacteroidia bacterium]
MKTSNMYLNRLIILSDKLSALEERNPGKIYIADEDGTIEHFKWVLDIIPGYKNKINPNFRAYETLYGLAAYYGLTGTEVLHLFAVDCQEPCYGGVPLNSLSGPKELAQNIIALVNIKEAEEDVPIIRLPSKREKKNKVLTFKYKHEEKDYAAQYY